MITAEPSASCGLPIVVPHLSPCDEGFPSRRAGFPPLIPRKFFFYSRKVRSFPFAKKLKSLFLFFRVGDGQPPSSWEEASPPFSADDQPVLLFLVRRYGPSPFFSFSGKRRASPYRLASPSFPPLSPLSPCRAPLPHLYPSLFLPLDAGGRMVPFPLLAGAKSEMLLSSFSTLEGPPFPSLRSSFLFFIYLAVNQALFSAGLFRIKNDDVPFIISGARDGQPPVLFTFRLG